jgi:WXG100 family type VII secretion target
MSLGGVSGGYNTDVDVMDAAAKKVDAVNNQIQGQLKTLRGQVEATRSEWKGPAAAKFQSMMESWDKDAKQLNDALQSISQRMKSNRTGYAMAEQAVGDAMSKIQGRLGR